MRKNLPVDLTEEAKKVLALLSSNLTIKKIAQRLNKSDKTIYKHFSRLRKKGLITKYREITQDGRKCLWGYAENYRLHNTRVSIDIPKTVNFRKIRYNLLILRKIDYEKKRLGTSDYGYFKIDKVSVRVYPNRITIYFKNIWARTPQEATEKLMDDIFFYIQKLENIYKISLVKDNRLNLAIVSNEYAHIKDVLAKKYRNDGKTFYLRDENQELRLIVDFSNFVDELESVHKDYAEKDQFIAQKHIMDWLKNNPPTNSELAQNQAVLSQNTRDLVESISKLAESESFNREQITSFNKNLQLHLEVLQEMKGGLQKISESQIELSQAIKESKKPFWTRWLAYLRNNKN